MAVLTGTDMWSAWYLVSCGLLLEIANVLWNRAGLSMVFLIAPSISSIGFCQFSFAWQEKAGLIFLVWIIHCAVFAVGRSSIAEARKKTDES